jgi:phenylacetate-CoA ligase
MNADRSALEQFQVRKLRALLAAIVPANPFYTKKLRGRVEVSGLKEFSEKVSLTTKHELVRDRLENPPYGTNLTFPLEQYVRCHQTSGSTAVPIRWLDTADSWAALVDNWVQILGAAGITKRDRFFFAFSFGPFLGFWSALEAVQRLGCFIFAGGAMSSVARLEAILDNRITVVCCTPTYAQHLGEVAREKKVDLATSRVRLFIVAGESGGSIVTTRARIEQLWPGSTVFDHHGMTEVGPVTYQCPARPGALHVLENAYVAEVLQPGSDTAAKTGETGELVLTTLDRIASPVLRYRTGDLVKARLASVCACGRIELALEGGILGRSDDMVVVRGVNVYPSLVEEIVRACPEICEYRVQLDSRDALAEVSVEIEAPDTDDTNAVAARLAESFQATLNLRVQVKVLPSGSIPRAEMKAQRWNRIHS